MPRRCINATDEELCAERVEADASQGGDNSSCAANSSNSSDDAADDQEDSREDEEEEEAAVAQPAADIATALPGPLAACGRSGYLSVYWAGKRKIYVRHMGDFNNWKPEDVLLPPEVDIRPGVPVSALSRPYDYNGVVWAGKGKIHHVYMDDRAWGVWKNTTITAVGMQNGTHIAATGQPGYMSLWWAAKRKVVRMHWGPYNNWTARTNYVPTTVPISPGTKMYAMSMSGTYAGVVWAGEGKIHHLCHTADDWGSFKYHSYEQAGITNSTPLASCGRPGFLGIFWAGENKVHMMRMTVHTGYSPEHMVLPPQVHIQPGMPLYAMCRDDQYNGVVWTGLGGTHHLYEDWQAWGEWKYHDLTLWSDGHVEKFGYDPLQDTTVHKDRGWNIPATPAGVLGMCVAFVLGRKMFRLRGV